ncbi:MAG: branched-chain amino acid ABC transporter permease [Bacillota bacterium]|jgi:branched-chain amino acid transport system permease protein
MSDDPVSTQVPTRRYRYRQFWPLALLAVAIALPWVFPSPTMLHVLIMVVLYAYLAQSWNIVGGYAGQLCLCHTVFFGLGAYTSSLLLIRFGICPWVGMLAGGVVASAVASALGYVTSRLSGHYFAMGTMAFGSVAHVLFLNWKLVRGAQGLDLPIGRESLLNFQFHLHRAGYFYIILALLVVLVFVIRWIESSRFGYYLRAIRGSALASEVMGINTLGCKVKALAISAFFAALAGTFFAQYVLYIDPESVLKEMLSIQICVIAILGGAGHAAGPLVGAAILIPVSELLRTTLGGTARGIDFMLYGAVIVAVALFQPGGVVEFFRFRVPVAMSDSGRSKV